MQEKTLKKPFYKISIFPEQRLCVMMNDKELRLLPSPLHTRPTPVVHRERMRCTSVAAFLIEYGARNGLYKRSAEFQSAEIGGD